MRRACAGFVACALLVSAGCKHDIQALQSGSDPMHLRVGGSGTGASGSSGASDAGAQGGSGGMDLPHPAAACEPCDELSAAAMAAGLRSCCRGLRGDACGLTTTSSALCLPRAVPGQSNPDCPGLQSTPGLAGCCRPDGRCGLTASALGLGCVARDEIPASIAGKSLEPIACDYTCEQDDECSVLPGGRVCAEDPQDGSRRICADDCEHDAECPRDQVCALANDVGMDRVLAFCQAPLSDRMPGDTCSRAEDCAQGLCLMDVQVCTALCTGPSDCPPALPRCLKGAINVPSGTRQDTFAICRPE